MTREAKTLLDAAMALSIEDRSTIALGLLSSLGPESQVARDGAFWEHELQGRAWKLDSASSRIVDAEEALNEVAASLGLD